MFIHFRKQRASMKLHHRTLILCISLISLQVFPSAAASPLTSSFTSFSFFLFCSILGAFQLTTCFSLPNDSFVSTSNLLCHRFLFLKPPGFFMWDKVRQKFPLKFAKVIERIQKISSIRQWFILWGHPTCLLLCKLYPPSGRAPNYRIVLLLAGRENIKRGVKVVTTNTVIKVILSTLKYPPHELSALKTSLPLRCAIWMHYHISSRRNTVHVGGNSSTAKFCYFQIRFISWSCTLYYT